MQRLSITLLAASAMFPVTAALWADDAEFASAKRPNIVFFLVDDLGWKDVGCFGSEFYETPHIDQLANDGIRFTDAYAACHVCSPTRASILTGKYPARLGLTDWIRGTPRLSISKTAERQWTSTTAIRRKVAGRDTESGRLPDSGHRQVAPRSRTIRAHSAWV